MMIKKLFIVSVMCGTMLLGACGKKENTAVTFSEQTTQAVVSQESTESTATTTETTNTQNQVVSFDNAQISTDNPIDNYVNKLFDEADTTLKINRASEQFYDLWKKELAHAADVCKKSNVNGYDDNELTVIMNKAQDAYNKELSNSGGSSATGSAMYAAGQIYRQGTYYYIELYKKHTNKEYSFSYR